MNIRVSFNAMQVRVDSVESSILSFMTAIQSRYYFQFQNIVKWPLNFDESETYYGIYIIHFITLVTDMSLKMHLIAKSNIYFFGTLCSLILNLASVITKLLLTR